MYKTHQVRTTFGSSDVQKLHAAVARSTFQSQNVKKLTVSDHFLKLLCGKIARRCSEKHILKSKRTKHCMFGPLFEVQMWKKLHAAVARSTFSSQNVQNTACSDHFLKLRCGKNARRCSEKHILKPKCQKTEGYGPLF